MVSAAPAVTANLPLASTPTLGTTPEDTDSMDTETNIDGGDLDSVFGRTGSEATITGLANTARPLPPQLTAATVEKRLQESVDDFALVLEMSCIEDGGEIPAALYLRLLRAMLEVCGSHTARSPTGLVRCHPRDELTRDVVCYFPWPKGIK